MKYLYIMIYLILPLIGFCQTEEEIKSMLTSSYKGYARYGINASTQKIIVENTWKRIYYYNYDKKIKIGKLTKANPFAVLAFDGKLFSYAFDGENILFSGEYSFEDDFIYTGFVEMGDYKIIDLIDNEYLVVERYLPTGINGVYKRTHCRELYQRQIINQVDRIPNASKAKQMFTEIPHLEDTIIKVSIEGIWKQIYTYKNFTKINDLQKITFENTIEIKDGKFYRNYPNGTYENVSGEYFINGVHLSFFSENGEGTSFKLINIFDNEYMVIERICISKNNKVQKPILRLLLKRIE